MRILFEVYLPKRDIFHDRSPLQKIHFGLIFDLGFFACGLMPFDAVYPKHVFESCLRS